MDKDEVREIRTEIMLDDMRRAESFSLDLLKWFATSFFVLNGGALIASIGISGKQDEIIRQAAPYFSVGIGTAVLAAFILALAFSAQANSISKQLWDMKLSEIEEASHRSSSQLPGAIFLVAIGLMSLSGGALVMGALEVADMTTQVER